MKTLGHGFQDIKTYIKTIMMVFTMQHGKMTWIKKGQNTLLINQKNNQLVKCTLTRFFKLLTSIS